jgi:hypothetical protein
MHNAPEHRVLCYSLRTTGCLHDQKLLLERPFLSSRAWQKGSVTKCKTLNRAGILCHGQRPGSLGTMQLKPVEEIQGDACPCIRRIRQQRLQQSSEQMKNLSERA